MVTFYYQPINWIKVAAVWVCDTVNKLYDPFEFNTDLPVCDSLNNLDKKFGDEIDAEFMMPSGEFLYQHPRPNDAGDTAIWHGICTGMKILRGNDVTAQLHFLKSLFVNNALIRGYHYGTNLPNDTTSNDSATGPLFAFYCALRFGDEETKAAAGALLLPWVKNLKEHNWALVDQTGVPTPFGKLENGIIMTDPLRITQLLAILSLAMAYDPAYHADYVQLYAKHKPILAYPKVKLLWLDTSYDTHRAAINLHILYWMTKDEVYRNGLRRIWRISKKSNNAWVAVLCAEAIEENVDSYVESILCTFDYQIRQFGNMQTLNTGWPSVKWGDKFRAKKPLPISKRGSQDFFWQRHMFSLAEWVGTTNPDTFHSGLDFLVCLHLARKLGMRV
jgi:hypothetical protein